MIIVADTGPVISLALVDQIHLLETIYGDVYLSPAVWNELLQFVEPFNIPKVKNLAPNVKSLTGLNRFTGMMDCGEAEAAALYQELNADFLIIDDRNARRIAQSNNIRCIGTIGILEKAKNLNLVSSLRPLFSILISKNRYYKKQLLNKILIDNGEASL
jgi:predicted nucleic acid-binding protein